MSITQDNGDCRILIEDQQTRIGHTWLQIKIRQNVIATPIKDFRSSQDIEWQ